MLRPIGRRLPVGSHHTLLWNIRPIKSKAVAHKPFTQVGAVHRTGCDRASIPIKIYRDASYNPPRDENIETVYSLRAALMRQTVLAAAEFRPPAKSTRSAAGSETRRTAAPRKGMANQAPASGCPCIHDSRRLLGIPKVRGVREGKPDLASYLAAKSSRRRFMNGSAFSARLRQRSACSFKNELSIFDSNATG
jgi:hypothetical protein